MKIRIAILTLIVTAALLSVPKHASAKSPVVGGNPPPPTGTINT